MRIWIIKMIEICKMALDLALKEYNVNVKTQFLILCTDWGIDCKNIIQGRNIFYGRENSYTGKDGKIRNVVNHKISLRAEITLINHWCYFKSAPKPY